MTTAAAPEFLVRIGIDLPPDLGPERRAALEQEERRVGADLVRDGVIVRIWRLPGQTANVGIWRAANATELHDRLRALPMWPWMRIEVTALAVHPLEAP